MLDSFRNPTACTQTVAVRMSDGTIFQQLSTSKAHQLLQQGSPLGSQAAANPQGLVFGAEVFAAGPVMVEVCIDGVQLQCGWPRSLLVLPGAPSAAHCVVRSLSEVCRVNPAQQCSAPAPHACLSCLHVARYPGHSSVLSCSTMSSLSVSQECLQCMMKCAPRCIHFVFMGNWIDCTYALLADGLHFWNSRGRICSKA